MKNLILGLIIGFTIAIGYMVQAQIKVTAVVPENPCNILTTNK